MTLLYARNGREGTGMASEDKTRDKWGPLSTGCRVWSSQATAPADANASGVYLFKVGDFTVLGIPRPGVTLNRR